MKKDEKEKLEDLFMATRELNKTVAKIKIDRLEAANARLFSDNADLESKLAKAVEALEFYADINNYDLGGDCPNAAGAWEMVVNPSTMGVCGDEFIEDCGDVARKALVQVSEKGE